jgi:hypothetical protein
MQHQRITRVINALASQDRILVHIACGHTVSVWRRDLMATPFGASSQLIIGETYPCQKCHDLPEPPPPTREKSPRELWRDAGEP